MEMDPERWLEEAHEDIKYEKLRETNPKLYWSLEVENNKWA